MNSIKEVLWGFTMFAIISWMTFAEAKHSVTMVYPVTLTVILVIAILVSIGIKIGRANPQKEEDK